MNKRLIKKYTNRRLYDTEDSRYVTLEDIRKLVAGGIDVEIYDEAKEEDITRALLLQIISEQEYAGRPIFNEQLLTQLIRFYGHPMQDFMGEYLSKSVETFMDQQKVMQDQFKKAMSLTSMDTMQDFANKNMESWMKFQQSFFKAKNNDSE